MIKAEVRRSFNITTVRAGHTTRAQPMQTLPAVKVKPPCIGNDWKSMHKGRKNWKIIIIISIKK